MFDYLCPCEFIIIINKSTTLIVMSFTTNTPNLKPLAFMNIKYQKYQFTKLYNIITKEQPIKLCSNKLYFIYGMTCNFQHKKYLTIFLETTLGNFYLMFFPKRKNITKMSKFMTWILSSNFKLLLKNGNWFDMSSSNDKAWCNNAKTLTSMLIHNSCKCQSKFTTKVMSIAI